MPDKDDKELGRLLHDRLSAAFDSFAFDNGSVPNNIVLAAFLSGAVRAIAACPCVEMRKVLVGKSISQIIEHANVPLVALVGEPMEAADVMLAETPAAGRA